jgi:hypothetical protein
MSTWLSPQPYGMLLPCQAIPSLPGHTLTASTAR